MSRLARGRALLREHLRPSPVGAPRAEAPARRRERISLLVTSASLVQPSGGDVVPSGRLLFHVESVDGLKVITWSNNGLTYALASDLDVEASRSCLVCHGTPADRRKVAPLRNPKHPWS